MFSYILIWALVLIIGTLLCFKILKSVLKTLAIASFIALLFIITTATLLYSDIKGLKADFSEGENLYILQEDDEVLFAMAIVREGNTTEYQEVAMSNEEMSQELQEGNAEEIRAHGNYKRLVVIDVQTYDALELQEKTALLQMIKDQYAAFPARAQAFEQLNAALLSQEGFASMINEYIKGNIEVYPKTLFFQLLSFIPTSQ